MCASSPRLGAVPLLRGRPDRAARGHRRRDRCRRGRRLRHVHAHRRAAARRYVEESAWLLAMHERGALIASVCAGSLMLAESGLLDGRSCAGHWAYVDLFASAYPRVRLQGGFDSRPRERGCGDRDRRWRDLMAGAGSLPHRAPLRTGPGHADGQGLPPRGAPGWSAAVLGDDSQAQLEDRIVAESATWIEANYATPNPVAAMTQRSGPHSSNLRATLPGRDRPSPIDYVHALRIEGARDRLESGDEPVDDIGFAVGYADPTFFRSAVQARHRADASGIPANVRADPPAWVGLESPVPRTGRPATRCGSASPRSGRRPPAP